MRLIRLFSIFCLSFTAFLVYGGNGGIPTPVSPHPRNVVRFHWTYDSTYCTDRLSSKPCTENAIYIQENVIETFASEGIIHSFGGETDADLWLDIYDSPFDGDGLINVYLRPLGDRLPQSTILLAHTTFPITTTYDRVNIRFDAHIQDSLDMTVKLIVGLGLYKLDRYDLALKYFDEVYANAALLQANINATEDIQALLLFYMGNCALVEKNLTDAAQKFEAALYSQDGKIYFEPAINLSWTYLQLGRDNEAFAILDELLKAGENPRYTAQFRINVLTKRSQLYALTFRYDEAIADMDAAITLDPGNPLLYVERGQHILLLYEWDRALADFNHALELVPGYGDAYYFRGILYASVPEGVEARQLALADFQHYLELAPNGQYAASAAENIISLQAQLDALGT